MNERLNVTKSYLPALQDYVKRLEQIWASGQLTNDGALSRELEGKLRDYFGVKHAIFVSNGTIAIQLAIQALGVKGDVITTPFTYVATSTALLWEHCRPVFVDIDPVTLCIDPEKIERAITPNTTAILGVHVYGYPCDFEKIGSIAQKHDLKVIYDGAHAMGVKIAGRSLLSVGDASTLSFHSTKLFHTVEGGAVITNDDLVADKIQLYRSFGHRGDEYLEAGINGKNSEFHAAMGLCNFPSLGDQIKVRKRAFDAYVEGLRGLPIVLPQVKSAGIEGNFSYFPVIFESEKAVLFVKSMLEKLSVFPRRYFYPSLNLLPYMPHMPCPVSEDISTRILCLPLSSYTSLEDVQRVIAGLKTALR